MRYYIVCPRTRTGGPENQHQLCAFLTSIGVEAYMVYHPNPDNNHELLYPEFTNVRVSEVMPDAPDCVIIIPEIIRIRDCKFEHSMIAVWWLSFTNSALYYPPALRANVLDDPNKAIHLFHSYFEYAAVRPFLPPDTIWFFLTDYIHDDFLALEPADFLDGKEDLVCFNAGKDNVSAYICEKAGIPYVPIEKMSRDEVMATLRRCKVYLDNGFHPGKDHLPREAAMHGCVVITNKSGSAAYHEDVPIDEKVTMEAELHDLIPDVLANYRAYFDKQEHYRTVIRSEKQCFESNARNFIEEMERIGADRAERERLSP